MSGKKKIGIAVGSLLAVVLAALGIYKVFFAPKGYTQNLTDPALGGTVVADYTKDESARTETFASGSKGYSWENGDPFNVWWRAENAVYANGKLTLTLSEMAQKEQVWASDGTSTDCLSEYYGSEVRSEHYYGYGDFQVRMKPAAIPGTASTFFTCTGPYDVWYNADGSVQRANDHDEIDIEFLGKDTTKVQFNYFASGKGGHEYMYDLGFDASKDFHNYGYRWSEEAITWFVDDKPVYKVLRSEIPAGEDWPEDPGRIVMNYWCGTANAALWMGTFQDDYSSGAEYEWVASSAAAQPDPSSTKPAGTDQPSVPANGEQDVQVPDTQWDALDLSAFDGWGKYTVAQDGGKVTISHDKKLQKYDCCGMDVNLGTRNKVSYTVTNAGSEKAFAKVSIKNTSVDNSAITSATINGGDAGYYEYGVLCELAPGESADVVMLLDLGKKPSQMVVSLNSEADSEGKAIRDDMPKTGKIVISELKAVKSDETALPGAGQAAGGEQSQQPGAPKAPEGPATEWAELDLSAFDGWGKYTVAQDGGKVTVSHDKKLQKYDCCGMDVNLGTRNKVSYTVTNAGSEKAYAKVSIKNTSVDNSAITSATINGGDAGYYEYGVLCELAPGESADVVMLLDLGKKPSQMVVSLNSEADSEGKAIRGDMPKTGKVVISDLKAVKSDETALPGAAPKTQQPAQPSQPAQPQQPDVPATEWAALDLSAFDGWGKYTVAKADGAITVSHDKAVAMYDCCGVDIALGERNKVQFSLTNNGAEKAFAKVNVKDRADSTGVSSISSAAVNGVAVGYVQYGVLCELEPGQSAQVEIYVDGVHPADQLVVSLNSEADSEGKALRSDMPQNGSVILTNLRAVKTDALPAAPAQPQQPTQPNQPAQPQQPDVPATEWAALDLSAFDGWGKYTVAKAGGAITVSHDKAVAMYDCCGGEIALGSRNKVKLTLTNNGAEKAYAKVNINDKAVTTGISSIASATVNGADAGYIEYGVLCELPAGESAQVELLTAPGKAADQLIISLNSEGDSEGKALRSDMPKAGKLTVSNVQAVKTDETTLVGAGKPAEPAVPAGPVIADGPLDQWADVDLSGFDGWGSYTVEKTAGSMTMSHDKALKQYACGGMSFVPGERNKVKMTITNNGDETAQAKVSIKSDTVDKSAIMGAKVDGKGVGNVEYGVMCKVPAGKSVELVVFLNLKKDIKQFVVSLNSEKTRGMPTSGSITISGVQAIQSDERFTLASSALSGGGGGGGGGGSVSAPPATPDSDGKLDLNSTSGSGWNTSTVAESAGDGGVKLSHSSKQGIYGNYSWPVDMGENNKLELDVVNTGAEKAYAKVSLTDNDDGLSVLSAAKLTVTSAQPAPASRNRRAMPSPMAALLRSGGEETRYLTGDAVKYGVLCELEQGQTAHLELFVQENKAPTKLVVSLNSEGKTEGDVTILDPNMPETGSVTLENIVCAEAEPEEPGPDDPGPTFTDPTTDWDLSGFDGWGKYTVTKESGSVQISHTEQRDQWNCCGIGGVDFGDAESVMFTVTNSDPANQAKVRFKVVKSNPDPEKEVNAVKSATVAVDGGDPAEVTNPAEVDMVLDAGKSAVVRIALDPEKHADQMTVFLNSTDAEGRLPAGSITISGAKWDKENDTPVTPGPEPTPGGDGVMMGQTKLTFSTQNAYTIAYAEDNSAMTVSYDQVKYNSYWNIDTEIENIVAVGDTLKFKVTNDNDNAVKLGTKIQGASEGEVIHDGTVMVAKGTQEIEVTVEDKGYTPKGLYLFIDSGWDADSSDQTERAGELTFSNFTLTKAEEPGPGPEEPDPEPTIPEGWEALDLSGLQNWGGEFTFDYTNGATASYEGKNPSQYVFLFGKELSDNNATELKITIRNNKDAAAKVTVAVNKSDDSNAMSGAKVDGTSEDTQWGSVVAEIPGKGSKTWEITFSEGAKLAISLNCREASNNPTEGSITITEALWNAPAGENEPDPEPVIPEGWEALDLSGLQNWGGEFTFDYTNGATASYEGKNPSQYVFLFGKELSDNNATELKITIRNNKDAAAKVTVAVNKSDDSNAMSGAKVDGTSEDTQWGSVVAEIPGKGSKTWEITFSEGAKLAISLNCREASNNPTEGSITITEALWNAPAGENEPAVVNAFPAGDPVPQPNQPPVTETVQEEKPPMAAPPATPPAEEKPEEKPDEPVTDEPIIDEPVADEPVTDAPVTDEPVTDEPVTDEPVVDEPVVNEPVIDAPVVNEPVIDAPVVNEPVIDAPVVNEPVIDEPVVNEPVIDEPVVDEPVVDAPVIDEPLADEEVPAQNEDEEQPDQNADEEQNEPTEE